jgi:predicted metal-dependent peptidase
MNQLYIKARARLILDNPFFGTLCLRLKPVEWEEQTGATDGVHLFYNPKWFEKLSEIQRIGFLAHEVMHVVLLHITRRQERGPEQWNVACDYAINNYLIAENFILPDGGLVDEQYNDMTAEAIYNLLPEPPKGWAQVALDSGKCGGVLDHPSQDGTSGTAGAIEAELTVAINQAAESAKAQGKLSANMESIVSEIVEPKVDWPSVLARFMRANNKTDFTWVKPNRRFISTGLYLPALHNPALEEVAIIADTSGSVLDDVLTQFTSETSAILRDLNPEKIHFLQCDAEVNEVTEYTRESLPLKVTYKGRGGTAFRPAFDYINEHMPQVRCAVYLTDLCSDDFGDEPPYDVLWISTLKDQTAPFGEVVYMNN